MRACACRRETAAAVASGDAPKGEVLGTARLAGIQAAKQTAQLIPLAHPLAPSVIDVRARVDVDAGLVELESEVAVADRDRRRDGGDGRVRGRGADRLRHGQGPRARASTIEQVVLLEKTGGRTDWRRDEGA